MAQIPYYKQDLQNYLCDILTMEVVRVPEIIAEKFDNVTQYLMLAFSPI